MDLKSLKKTRASHKAKLTIFKSYIETFLPNKILNKVQVLEITARLNKILELYSEFDSIQTDIEGLVEIPGEEHKEREIFETSYFGCVAVAQELLSAASAEQETGSALRNTIDSVNKNLRALKTLKLPTEHWDMIIIHMVTSKLDSSTIRDWEKERNNITHIPTLHDFNTFLKNRADILETVEESSTHKKQQQTQRRHSDITHNRPKTFLVSQTQKQARFKCPVCKGHHTIYQCTKFKSMPIETRIEQVKQLNLCTNCLRSGHDEQRCRLSSCRLCTQRHNTMLHNNTTVPKASTSSEGCVVLPTVQEQKQPQSSSVTLSSINHCQVLLSTAVINIQDLHGHTYKVRALLDNGSTSSFITEALRVQLGIPSYSTSLLVQGLNNQSSEITQRCDVTISSLTTSGYTTDINCFVVPHITQLIPTSPINCNSFSIPPRIHLADPNFSTPSEVQMLLGADIFWDVLLNNHISLGKNKPTLIETTLGWLVTGSVQSNKSTNNINQSHTVHCHFLNNNNIEEKLDKFFELESVPTTQQVHTKGESECEQIFKTTTKRHTDGKFIVTIPFKESPEVLGDSKQQALIRFQSLEHSSQPIKQYKLNTITYGMASAPYLATRCLVQLGQECTDKDVRESILHDFYVDDYVAGHEDETTLIQRCKGVIQVLESAHFHLRKWRSNKPSIVDEITSSEVTKPDDVSNLNKVDRAKTLGLLWTCKKDTLLFSVNNISKNKHINKRTILSTIAQVFDPLGLINPCMLQAKLILQTLWAKNITWDDQLPAEVESQWHDFIEYLPEITKIEIPRRVLCDSYIKVELHAFSDASIKAFSACVYVRTVSDTGNVQVQLLLSKSRVAPLKHKLTMPRLELCGALLATRLMDKVVNSLRLKIDSNFYWCDSTIVLGWIKSCKLKLKQFVYNRIHEITNNSDPNSWNYIPTEMNPADIGSRGLNAAQLQSSLLWWGGPHFLHQTTMQLPTQPKNLNIASLPEIKHQCHLSTDESHCHNTHINFFMNFSDFGKLQRTVAYAKRFIFNCQHTNNKMTGPLTVKELNSALQVLCKQSLKTHFWNRYYKEYVSELQIRNKWRTDKGQPQPGDMVLIKDDRLPPNRWLLGRVTTVYPGTDGVNRVADVATTSGTLRRAWNRLCPLPVKLDQDAAPAPRGPAC
uniref:SFRICE_037025 n=1 Tax=Spodoptera frugiperda TaxID=7108 RepID=A0A2H1WRL5_SPOFR